MGGQISMTSAAVRSAEYTAEKMSDVGVRAVRCDVSVLIGDTWRPAHTGEIVSLGEDIKFGLDGSPA